MHNATPQPYAAAPPPRTSKRPKLTAETAVEQLEWIAANAAILKPAQLEAHLAIAELAVRVLMAGAQSKATLHTLVEDGTIAPPPPATTG